VGVLLINPPWMRQEGNIWTKIAGCVPPLGLAQIAACLERNNVKVRILDAAAENISFGAMPDELRKLKNPPQFVGITASTSIIREALETARLSKKIFPATRIVLGGIHPSLLPDEILAEKFVDYVVRGEGEETFLELITGKPAPEILGLSYKNNSHVIHNGNRAVVKNLDDLPIPAYHLLPMKKYHPALGSYSRLPGIGMLTTRGCPGKCTFCFGQYLGERIRMRSADNIIKEIQLLQKSYGIREVSFYDDTFTTFQSNVRRFCELLLKNEIDITWSCFTRVDFVNEEILSFMKRAGCHQICYGIESGSEKILRNIKKKISLDRAKQAVEMTKKAGIKVRATFMLGSPGETVTTMRKTIKFAIALEPDIALFNITTPYPGTEMHKWADENGYLITKNWSKYDLSMPVMNLPGVRPREVVKYYKKAYFSFYCRPGYILRRIFGMNNLSDVMLNIKALCAVFATIFK